jgi:uncharacterized membrane protein YkvA (DUF1232 family)
MTANLRDWARAIRRDAHALYLAARDPRTPWHVKVLAMAIAAYALSPIDLIPDFIPVIGYLDEVILLPLVIAAVVKLIPPEIMAEHRTAAGLAVDRPTSRMAAFAIAVIWAAAIALTGWLVYKYLSA